MAKRIKRFYFNGAEVILNPNGSDEIWIKDQRDLMIALRISNGPHGLGLQLRPPIGKAPLTVSGNVDDRDWTPKHCGDFAHLEVTQYSQNVESLAFKRKYLRGTL